MLLKSAKMSHGVWFKFKSEDDNTLVAFTTPSIKLPDLKREIIQRRNLGDDEGFDLLVKDTNGREYKDDDVVKKHTYVIVQRVTKTSIPGHRRGNTYSTRKPVTVEADNKPDNEPAIKVIEPKNNNAEDFGGDIFQPKAKEIETKEDEIPLEKQQSSDLGHADTPATNANTGLYSGITIASNRVNKGKSMPERGSGVRTANKPRGLPVGFSVQSMRKPRGFPKSVADNANGDEDKQGTNEPSKMTGAWSQFKTGESHTKRASALSDEAVRSRIKDSDIPVALKCQYSKKLLTDAVMLPCCFQTCSYGPLQSALLSQNFVCPLCETTQIGIDKLMPNKQLRAMVDDFIKDQRKKMEAREQSLAQSQSSVAAAATRVVTATATVPADVAQPIHSAHSPAPLENKSRDAEPANQNLAEGGVENEEANQNQNNRNGIVVDRQMNARPPPRGWHEGFPRGPRFDAPLRGWRGPPRPGWRPFDAPWGRGPPGPGPGPRGWRPDFPPDYHGPPQGYWGPIGGPRGRGPVRGRGRGRGDFGPRGPGRHFDEPPPDYYRDDRRQETPRRDRVINDERERDRSDERDRRRHERSRSRDRDRGRSHSHSRSRSRVRSHSHGRADIRRAYDRDHKRFDSGKHERSEDRGRPWYEKIAGGKRGSSRMRARERSGSRSRSRSRRRKAHEKMEDESDAHPKKYTEDKRERSQSQSAIATGENYNNKVNTEEKAAGLEEKDEEIERARGRSHERGESEDNAEGKESRRARSRSRDGDHDEGHRVRRISRSPPRERENCDDDSFKDKRRYRDRGSPRGRSPRGRRGGRHGSGYRGGRGRGGRSGRSPRERDRERSPPRRRRSPSPGDRDSRKRIKPDTGSRGGRNPRIRQRREYGTLRETKNDKGTIRLASGRVLGPKKK